MEEALTMEEKLVKEHNLKKGIEKKQEPIEKEINGETWVKKEQVVILTASMIEAELKALIDKVMKGRTAQDAISVLRPIIKKLIYQIETKEIKSEF